MGIKYDLIFEPVPGQQRSLEFDSALTALMWIKGKAPVRVVEIRERRAARQSTLFLEGTV